MRLMQLVTACLLATIAMAVVMPSKADAFFRVGAEVRWVPLGVESMDQEGETFEDTQRELEGIGLGIRALLGFEYLSLGAKANLTHHSFRNDGLNYTQFDVNAHLRSGMPLTRIAFFLEAGPSLALDIGEVGYNGAVGAEVDVLGWPLLDVNLGLALQYAHVPIGAGPSEIRINEGFRGMVILGVDVSLFD